MRVFILIAVVTVYILVMTYMCFKRNDKLVMIKMIQGDVNKGIQFLLWHYKIKVVHNRNISYNVLINWLKEWKPNDEFEQVIKSSLIVYLIKDEEDTSRLDVCTSIYLAIRGGIVY